MGINYPITQVFFIYIYTSKNFLGSEFNPRNCLHNKESSTSSLYVADISPIANNNETKKITTPHLTAKFNCKKDSDSRVFFNN